MTLSYTGLPPAEVERRYRLVREAMARDGLDAVIVCGNEYTGLRGGGHVPLRLRDRPPLRVRPAAARGRAGDRLPERGPLRRRARDDLDRRAGVRRPAGRVARRRGVRGQAGRRLRARLRDDRPRLPRARGRCRARPVGRRVRPRARGQVRAGARLGARVGADQHRGLPASSSRRSRPGKTRARGARAVRAVLRRAGLRPLDDGHGARRRRTARRCPSSRSPATRRFEATDMVLPSLEVAGPGGHWVEVSRAICAGRPERPRRSGCSRPTRSTTRRRDRRAAGRRDRARRRTGPSRRASSTAATRSATSPATRSG